VFVLLCCVVCSAAQAAPAEGTIGWIRHVVPLPKSISIAEAAAVAPSAVEIAPPAGDDKIVAQACKELREAIGIVGSKAPANPAFKIELSLGGADELRGLKNSDQAYSIKPVDGNRGLRLAALAPRGLYYASKTLQQLIRARATKVKVQIPIVTITDWPDLQDRGLWGGDSAMHCEWLAERKLNVTENISTRDVDKDGRGHSGPKSFWKDALTEGPIRGINVIPAVLHLEQVAGPYSDGKLTLFDIYPNLKAKDSEGGAICYSQPQFVDVLADWIVELKSLPNVTEVSVWLAENLHGVGGCKCDQCAKTDRTVLETRTVLAAWKKAKERVGDFGLRVLTSEETRSANKLMLDELPSGVKVWFYDSLFTYTTGKEPMVFPEFEEFAKKGGWVGVVPNISAFVRLVHPFTCPDFSHYRLNDFVDHGMSGLLGYACMGLMNSRFLVEGAAEWGWNAKGRTPHEFALSWAVRQKLKDPEAFAAWTDTNGPVAWDVYGSDFPYSEKRNNPGPIAKLLRAGTLPPLGQVSGAFRGPWGQIKTIEQFDKDVAAAAKSVKMARKMGIPEFEYESLVIDGYIRAIRAAYDLGPLVPGGKLAPGKEKEAAKLFKAYIAALNQSLDALPKWLNAASGAGEKTFLSTEVVAESIRKMEQLAADLGLDLAKAK